MKYFLFGTLAVVFAIVTIFCGNKLFQHLYAKSPLKSEQNQVTIPKEGIKDDGIDWASAFISSLGLIVSVVGFWYVIRTFDKDIQSRNLNYLAELDKMLIEDPYLWAFYDEHEKSFHSDITHTSAGIEIKEGIETLIIKKGNGVTIMPSNAGDSIEINGRQEITPYRISSDTELSIHIRGSVKISNIGVAEIRFQSSTDKLLKHKLRAFVYFKMNHYEVFINDRSLRKEWQQVTMYNLKVSTCFRDQLKTVLEGRNSEYKGLYLERTYEVFRKIYNKYAEENGVAKIN